MRRVIPFLALALAACSHTNNDLPQGPDCAYLGKTDLACIDYTTKCGADADCGPKPATCTKDTATSLAYTAPVCRGGNCGYSVTPTTCATACTAGGCPGDASTDLAWE